MTEQPGGPVAENRHDLVVLAQGMIPHWDAQGHCEVRAGEDGFVATPDPISPARTHGEGLFVAGTACGPKDIVDTIVEAGSAAMQASEYIHAIQTDAGESSTDGCQACQAATAGVHHD